MKVGFGYASFQSTPLVEMNFTHRIDAISFGTYYPGLINPLDMTHEVATEHLENFKYYLGLVPTIYIDRLTTLWASVLYTTQYAVTEFARVINVERPDALPGI